MLDQKEENKEVLEELKKVAEENSNEKVTNTDNGEIADITGAFSGSAEDEIAADSESITDNLETQDIASDSIENEKEDKFGFFKALTSIIVDAGIMGVISFAGLFLVDAILRAAGLYIIDKLGASLVIFVVIYILYGTIMMSGKKHSTFGMRASKLKVTLDK